MIKSEKRHIKTSSQMLFENAVGPTSGMSYAQTLTEYTTNLLNGYPQAKELGVDQKKHSEELYLERAKQSIFTLFKNCTE